jgi:hypothetical protein
MAHLLCTECSRTLNVFDLKHEISNFKQIKLRKLSLIFMEVNWEA